MNSFTKKEKRELKQLAGLGYERELWKALDELYSKFEDWKAKKVTPFDLSDEIHIFHNGISRDLWKSYNNRDNHIVVAAAIANGVISRKEVDGIVL